MSILALAPTVSLWSSARRSWLIACLCALASLASPVLAAATVALPSGEAPAPWGPALRGSGLQLASSGEADLVLIASGDHWVVRTPDGLAATVRAPRTPEERADLAVLLSSLVEPAEALDWDLVGSPRRPPPAPVRPPVRSPAPPSGLATPSINHLKENEISKARIFELEQTDPSEAAPAPSDLMPTLALSQIPLSFPEPLRPPRVADPLYLWLEAGAQVSARAELSPSGGSQVSVGLGRGAWRAGLRLYDEGEADLVALGEGRRVRGASGQAGLWWSPRVPVVLGTGGAVSRRVYSQGADDLQVVRTPSLWAETRAEPALGPGLRLAVGLRAAREIRLTELWVGQAQEGELGPWALSGALSLVGSRSIGRGTSVGEGDQNSAMRPRQE